MFPKLISAGKRTIGGLERIRLRLQPRVDAWLERIHVARQEREQRGFEADSDQAIIQQAPLRARILLKMIGVTFVVAVIWAVDRWLEHR